MLFQLYLTCGLAELALGGVGVAFVCGNVPLTPPAYVPYLASGILGGGSVGFEEGGGEGG